MQALQLLLAEALDDLRQQGLPTSVPLLMTEYGYFAFDAQAEVALTRALLKANVVGTFRALSSSTAYPYGYETRRPAPHQGMHRYLSQRPVVSPTTIKSENLQDIGCTI